MSKQTPVPLEFEGEELEGVFVGRRDGQARPTVILIPTVMGVSDLEIGFAQAAGRAWLQRLRRRHLRQEVPRRAARRDVR